MTDELNEQHRPNSDLVRFLVTFSALYMAFGVASPFLPAFLSSRGVTPAQIGLLLAAGTVIRLVSGPIAGRIADRLHARRVVLAICSLAAGGRGLGLCSGARFCNPAHGRPC